VTLADAPLEPRLRGIEDRLLVIETRLSYLATKAELADVKADVLRWYVTGWSSLVLLIVGATVVNHFWK